MKTFFYRQFTSLEKPSQTNCMDVEAGCAHASMECSVTGDLRKPRISRRELLGLFSGTIFPSSKRNELDTLSLVLPEKNVQPQDSPKRLTDVSTREGNLNSAMSSEITHAYYLVIQQSSLCVVVWGPKNDCVG